LTEAPGPDIALHGVPKRFGAHVAVDDVVTNFNAARPSRSRCSSTGAAAGGAAAGQRAGDRLLLGVLGLMVPECGAASGR
jgi:hypothetical protein